MLLRAFFFLKKDSKRNDSEVTLESRSETRAEKSGCERSRTISSRSSVPQRSRCVITVVKRNNASIEVDKSNTSLSATNHADKVRTNERTRPTNKRGRAIRSRQMRVSAARPGADGISLLLRLSRNSLLDPSRSQPKNGHRALARKHTLRHSLESVINSVARYAFKHLCSTRSN